MVIGYGLVSILGTGLLFVIVNPYKLTKFEFVRYFLEWDESSSPYFGTKVLYLVPQQRCSPSNAMP